MAVAVSEDVVKENSFVGGELESIDEDSAILHLQDYESINHNDPTSIVFTS